MIQPYEQRRNIIHQRNEFITVVTRPVTLSPVRSLSNSSPAGFFVFSFQRSAPQSDFFQKNHIFFIFAIAFLKMMTIFMIES